MLISNILLSLTKRRKKIACGRTAFSTPTPTNAMLYIKTTPHHDFYESKSELPKQTSRSVYAANQKKNLAKLLKCHIGSFTQNRI